jgi:hypothetical protein
MVLLRYIILGLSATPAACGQFATSMDPHPIVVTATDSPQYKQERYDRPAKAKEDRDIIRVIGIYEGSKDQDENDSLMADVDVEVADQGDKNLYLVLSAYRAVNWRLKGPGVKSVRGVMLNGYSYHAIGGIPNSRVVNKSGPENYIEACVFTYHTKPSRGCDSPTDLFSYISKMSDGDEVDSYLGVYNAKGFLVK